MGVALTGCKERGDAAPPSPASAAASAPRAPARSAALAASAPAGAPGEAWYAGTWRGTYESSLHRIDLPTKQGGLAEWAADDGRRGVGSGTLSITPSADGTATGTAEGPLGSADLQGAFEGDSLSLRLVPKTEEGAFSGVIVAHRDGDRLVGTLRASTPDGRVAREGTITLTRIH